MIRPRWNKPLTQYGSAAPRSSEVVVGSPVAGLYPGRARLPSTVAATLLALALFMVPGRAQSSRELIRQGNEHFAAGRYAEALASYKAASEAGAAQTPELLHDLAATYFKLGQIEEARDLWTRIKEARDATFEARARYNLGNCDYADALAAGRSDLRRALERLGQAREQYLAALRLDRSLADARANLELAQLLKQQLEQQQQDQAQTQGSSTQPGDQPPQDQQPPSTQPSESQEHKSQESSEEQSATTQPAPPQEPEAQPEQQEEAQEQPPETQPASAAETQPTQTQPAPSEAEEPEPVHLSREQAERLLQMIRDAEKARREKLLQQRAVQQKPVERDW